MSIGYSQVIHNGEPVWVSLVPVDRPDSKLPLYIVTDGDPPTKPPEDHPLANDFELDADSGRYHIRGRGSRSLISLLSERGIHVDPTWTYPKISEILVPYHVVILNIDRSKRPNMWTLEYRN